MDIDFLWNVAQHRQIASANREAAGASETARRAAASVLELQVALERLSLTCRAMWELLRERTEVSEDDLIARVREIDLRDRQPDGRARPAARKCPQCSRVNNVRRERCLYCGEELGTDSAFDQV